MPDAVPLVETTRGPFLESRHFGHAVIARANGEVVAAWGDANKIVLPRSSHKMLQALPLVESGAAASLTSEQLALACASHSAEEIHITRVAAWLNDLGLQEHDLCCGPTPSLDQERRHQMIRDGQLYSRLHSDCSGKHAGFLTLSAYLSADNRYVEPDHPVQRAVRGAIEEMAEQDSPGFGIDGCSAPNYALSLVGMATAMAKFATFGQGGSARDMACVALREAMMRHPELVSGTRRSCNDLMRAARGKAAVKSGAEGFYVAILPDVKLGIALKIEDGATRASEAAMAALLVRCGAIEAHAPGVKRYLNSPVQSFNQELVGTIRPAASLLA
ncbi:MAG: asparaginase [Pseudomonadota bacterium]